MKEFEYNLTKENANALKIIQIGITLSNERGEVPSKVSTWQFNFHFDLSKDQCNKDALDLLKNSGIDFQAHKIKGIDPFNFADLVMSSGMVLNESVKWVCFHGSFDFAYFLRIMLNQDLPETSIEFTRTRKFYFPKVIDIKYMLKDFSEYSQDGLNKLASQLKVRRIGIQHQAGSDSLLTLALYFTILEKYFKSVVPEALENVIYGIGKGHCPTAAYLENYRNYIFFDEEADYNDENFRSNVDFIHYTYSDDQLWQYQPPPFGNPYFRGIAPGFEFYSN